MTAVNSLIRAADIPCETAAMENQTSTKKVTIFKNEELKEQLKKGKLTAVQAYNEYIDSLITIQEECAESLNWDIMVKEPEPGLPARLTTNQDLAEAFYKSYKPSFLDRVLGQNQCKLKALSEKIHLAKQADDKIYNITLKEFRRKLQNWTKIQAIRKGIKNSDPLAFKDAIDFFDPFAVISQFGVQLEYQTYSGYITVDADVDFDAIIPNYILSKTESDKLYYSSMSLPAFNELCQDFICGTALRIARETFSFLPVKCVLVNAISNRFNIGTGYTESKTILSVKFNTDSIRMLHFNALDCAASLVNFPHHMNFSKNNGFLAVKILEMEKILH